MISAIGLTMLVHLASGVPEATRADGRAATPVPKKEYWEPRTSGETKLPIRAKTPARPEPTYDVIERQSLVLGGPSGQYTEWRRYALRRFDGLATTIKIDGVHVKKGDKYAPIARVGVFGDGEEKKRPTFSVRIQVNLETKKRMVFIDRGPNIEPMGGDLELPANQPIMLEMTAVEPGKLHLWIDGNEFDVTCDFKITGMFAVGSGVDVEFDPFTVLQRRDGK